MIQSTRERGLRRARRILPVLPPVLTQRMKQAGRAPFLKFISVPDDSVKALRVKGGPLLTSPLDNLLPRFLLGPFDNFAELIGLTTGRALDGEKHLGRSGQDANRQQIPLCWLEQSSE